MAINVDISKITGINQVGNSYQRKSAVPLDYFSFFNTKAAAEEYATSNPVSYVGQFLAYTDNNAVVACVIGDTAGNLIQLAQSAATGNITSDLNAAVNRIAANEGAITALQTLTATLKSQIESNDQDISDINTSIGADGTADTIKGRIKQLETLVAGLRTDVDKKVASIGAADKSVTVAGKATAPTVAVAISTAEGNAIELGNDGLYVPSISISESTPEGVAKRYTITQGDGASVNIDIPKDMVVSGGTVETYKADTLPEGVTKAGTYIVLTLANAESDKLYIPTEGLLDFDEVKGGTTNTVKITSTKNDDGSVTVTADLVAGSVTKTLLAQEVKDSLDLADTAVQEVKSGSTNGTVAVDGTDVAVTGLKSAAFVETSTTVANDGKLPTGSAVTAAIANAVSDACSVYRFEE